MFCHQCGKEIREGARFCFDCGAPVREAPEPAGAAEAQMPDRQTENAAIEIRKPDSLTANADPATKESHDRARQENPSVSDGKKAHGVQQNAAVGTAESDSQAHASSRAMTQGTASDSTSPAPEAQGAAPGSTSPAPEAQGAVPGGTSPAPEAHGAAPGSCPASSAAQDAESGTAADAEAPGDLVLKRRKVAVIGRELHLNGKYYARKPGKKKFKKKRKASPVPFDAILGTTVEHHRYGGRMFLSLLLLVCFAAGALFSARLGYDTYNELNTPYRDEELASQSAIMDLIDNSGSNNLLQLQRRQEQNRADTDALTAKLAELEEQQTQELLDAACASDNFDLDAFFNRDLFARAYREYLQELLDAFKADELLDSWLYSYYRTVDEYGGNYFLNTDMWIYDGGGENKYSPDLDSASALMKNQYDLDLYEHFMYSGHIYITGADFMREILSLPRYTVDGAVFVKAYGGVPDPSEMSVPGWSRSHYDEFWLYGEDYYYTDTPLWLDQGLQTENFDIDWNLLLNEAAYYDAYISFMDRIAPGLPRCEMAVYHADDEAYGGMGYDLAGEEASFSDMIAVYADDHPEFTAELMKDYGRTLTTSVDGDIAGAQARLEDLARELRDLEDQERDLAQLLADADSHRSCYELLTTDIEQHTQELNYRLLFLGGCAILGAFAALVCLCRFFSFLRRPRHLLVIRCQDMELAFNTRRCSKKQLAALQNRLPGQTDPQG